MQPVGQFPNTVCYLGNQLAQISCLAIVPVDGLGWIPFSTPLIIIGDALPITNVFRPLCS